MKPETATERKAYTSQSVTAGSRESVGERSWSLPAAVVMITMEAWTTDSVGGYTVTIEWKDGGRRCLLLIAKPVAKYWGSGMMLRMISTCGAGVTDYTFVD